MGINTFEDLIKVNLPVEIIKDIDKRVTDWLATGGNEDDPYVRRQFKYAENFLRTTKR